MIVHRHFGAATDTAHLRRRRLTRGARTRMSSRDPALDERAGNPRLPPPLNDPALSAGMRFVFHVLALSVQAACAPGDFSYSKRIDGPYRVLAIDDLASMHLCYDTGRGCAERVPATVHSVGWDERYVVVARRSSHEAAVSEYFYIDRAQDPPGPYRVAVNGPFDEASFARERAQLSLPEFMRDVPFIYGGDSPRRGRFEDIFK